MNDCIECRIARTTGPCPHDAVRAVQRYGADQYTRGLRTGLDILLDLLHVVDGHQEDGKRRRPIPLSVVRSALRSKASHIISGLAVVDYPLSEQWTAEAGKAFDGDGT